MADKKPLLDLEKLEDRPFVRIAGEDYELRNSDEFTIVEHQRLNAWARKYDRLAQADELTPEQEEELARLPRLILEGRPDRDAADNSLRARQRGALLAPKEVIDDLSDGEKAAIMTVFFQLLETTNLSRRTQGLKAVTALMKGDEEAEAEESTGEISQPD